MEEIIINGMTIYLKSGIKYRKSLNGHLVVVCASKDCNKVTNRGIYGHYCRTCLIVLGDNDPIKMKKIVDDQIKYHKIKIKEFEDKQKINHQIARQNELDKSKIIIDGIEIYIINSVKYRKKPRGTLELVCIYDNCNKFQKIGKYCQSHRNGTTIDSPERQLEKKELSKQRKLDSKKSSKKGDDTELWVIEKLKLINFISDISCIGYTGSKYDIEFKLKNDHKLRGIQVKTLTKCKSQKDGYRFTLKNQTYSDNVLIIGVNNDRTRFVIGFFKDFKSKYPTFTFSNDKSYYQNIMFSNCNKFIKKLKMMLTTTDVCDKDCFSSKSTKLEYHSLERLSTKCNENALEYNRVKESGSIIDCIINSYNIQHKSTKPTKLSRSSFQFNIFTRKSSVPTPYSDKDGIDFFIFEIVPFQNNFYIVPIEILIEQGYIQTNDNTGKLGISIPNPKMGNQDHWINKYLNNFSLLKPKKKVTKRKK